MDNNLQIFNNGRAALLRDRFFVSVFLSLFCLGAMAQTAADVPDAASLRPALRAIGTVTEFHRMAMGDPDVAVETFFENRCLRRWRHRMELLKKPQLVDFFVGAMEITGSYDRENAVSAIYNPFWDTILLLELRFPEMGGKASVAKFALLSGETFRGEKPAEKPYATVISNERPQIVELATVYSKTAERFDMKFPMKSPPNLGEYAFPDMEEEMKLIAARSALRLKLIKSLLVDKAETKLMKNMQILLQHGRRDDFRQLFWNGKYDTHIRTLMAMPDDVREQFVLYYYCKRPNYSVFMYIPLFMPRLVAVVTLPKDDALAPTLEIHDLNDSKALVKSFNALTGGDGK